MRLLVILIGSVVFFNTSLSKDLSIKTRTTSCNISGYTQVYDKYFKSGVARFWPQSYKDWCWLKAQAIAESNLIPTAISSKGARGILQIMPNTWKDLKKQYKQDGNIFEAKANIMYSAAYMRKMLDFWIFDRTALCRLELAQASYNAGAGNILKAQGLAQGARCWDKISEQLANVTGSNALETIEYVERIAVLRRGVE